jgi:ParB family chromosome partitioning protein
MAENGYGWGELVKIPVDKIRISPMNVRIGEAFGDEEDKKFEKNISSLGLLSPPIVRPVGDMYELVAGRRRFLALKGGGETEIDCIVKELEDTEALDASLSENVFRKAVDPVTLGRMLKKRLEMEEISLGDYAKKLGKAKSTLSEWMGMNDLVEDLQREVQEGSAVFTHALRVVRMELSPEEQRVLAEEARTGGPDAFRKAVDRVAAGREKRGAPKGLLVVRISFGQESAEYEALRRMAERDGMKLSDYCEKILMDHVRGSNRTPR